MAKFEVEFSYTMTGTKVVEATSKEEAEEIVDKIPTKELGAEYLDDSFSFDEIEEIDITDETLPEDFDITDETICDDTEFLID